MEFKKKKLCPACGGTGVKMVTTYEGNSELKKQKLCEKVILVWDELCSNEPIIISDAKNLRYSFVINNQKILTLSIYELKLMDRYVYSHFQRSNICFEDTLADIGLWTFTNADDLIISGLS